MLALGIFVMVSLGAPAPTCVVHDRVNEWLALPIVAEGESFAVNLRGVSLEVALDDASAEVRASSPIAFTTRVEPRLVPLGVAKEGWLTDVVFATRKTWFVALEVDGDRLRAGFDLPAHDIYLEPVTARCDRFGLRATTRAPIHHVEGDVLVDGPSLSLQARPDQGPVYTITQRRRHALGLHEIAKRRGWVRVEARWSDGTKVRGWTSADGVKKDHVFPRIGGYGTVGHGCSSSRRRRALPIGTSIHASPDGPIWATVTTPITVDYDPETHAGWWRVTRMPGLAPDAPCTDLAHVWVRPP